MKKAIVFEAQREGYGIDQLRRPMTVGELRDLLDGYEDDTLFVLSHDNRYTFGSIRADDTEDISLFVEGDDGEWEESEEKFWDC